MQVSAMIITYSRNNKLLTKCCYITQLHRRFTFVHLSYSHLTISHSLFLFPFNTCQLLSKHREVVCNPRLHNDCGRPTTISYKTLNNTRSRYSFTAHSEPSGNNCLSVGKYHLIKRVCVYYFCSKIIS